MGLQFGYAKMWSGRGVKGGNSIFRCFEVENVNGTSSEPQELSSHVGFPEGICYSFTQEFARSAVHWKVFGNHLRNTKTRDFLVIQ